MSNAQLLDPQNKHWLNVSFNSASCQTALDLPYIGTAACLCCVGGVVEATTFPPSGPIGPGTGTTFANGDLVGSNGATLIGIPTPLSVALGGTANSNRTLTDSSSNTSANWQSRTLIDSIGNVSVNWQNRSLVNSSGITQLTYGNLLNFPTLTPSSFLATDGSSNVTTSSFSLPVSIVNGGTGLSYTSDPFAIPFLNADASTYTYNGNFIYDDNDDILVVNSVNISGLSPSSLVATDGSNNLISVSGPVPVSGPFSATVNPLSNMSGVSVTDGRYIQIGSQVQFQVNFNASVSSATTCSFTVSLPVSTSSYMGSGNTTDNLVQLSGTGLFNSSDQFFTYNCTILPTGGTPNISCSGMYSV